MFEEVVGNNWFNLLDKECCYSFVLQHKKNRIISNVIENKVIMVEKYKLGDDIHICELEEIPGIERIIDLDIKYLNNYNKNLEYSVKGFTIKNNDIRYNWINPNYNYVRSLKMNSNNNFLNYINLRKQWLLKDYLIYFPEDKDLFTLYKNYIDNLINNLYINYVNLKIRKNITIKDIEYSFRPLINELHKIYQTKDTKITKAIVKTYINKMDGKRLIFIIQHYTGLKIN
tara:strand:- start:594 stop:1280 length:687 start_codon:yes stop_codon:yes gene_type:complete